MQLWQRVKQLFKRTGVDEDLSALPIESNNARRSLPVHEEWVRCRVAIGSIQYMGITTPMWLTSHQPHLGWSILETQTYLPIETAEKVLSQVTGRDVNIVTYTPILCTDGHHDVTCCYKPIPTAKNVLMTL